MKIKETYIIYHTMYQEYVKIHWCINSSGSKNKYYIEFNNGIITELTGDEPYELLKDY